MITFLTAVAALIFAYFLYGKLVEKVFNIDNNRPTPAITMADGVDYVAMPTWKAFLIQLLNIAGTGPIFGALMGAVFGPIVYLWIVRILSIYYIDKIMKDMPFEQIATIFRARLDLLSDSSIVTETIDKIRQTGKAMTTAEGRQQVARSFMGGVFDVNLDYKHITHTGITQAAEEYVSNIYFQMFKKNPFITCVGVNYKNNIQLFITTKLSDEGFYDNICTELDNLGIDFSCKKMDFGGERFFEFDPDSANS